MGWCFGQSKVSNVKDHIENSTGLFTTSQPGHAYEVLDSAIVKSTYYAAVRRTIPGHAPYVFAAIILFRNPPSGFGYKDMDESMGPIEVSCPLRILALLSPIEDFPGGLADYKCATQWRAAVRQYHLNNADVTRTTKSFKAGDRIMLPTPIRFRSGFEENTFDIVSYTARGKNRTAYKTIKSQFLCLIPKRLLAGAVKVAN